MRLGIEHPILRLGRLLPANLHGYLRRVRQVRILECLGQEKARLVVAKAATGGRVDVEQRAEARSDARELVQVLHRVPDVVLVLLVAGGAVGVVEGLERLGPDAVAAVLDPEAGAPVEGGLVGRDGARLRLVLVEGNPAEDVRAETGAVVCLSI